LFIFNKYIILILLFFIQNVHCKINYTIQFFNNSTAPYIHPYSSLHLLTDPYISLQLLTVPYISLHLSIYLKCEIEQALRVFALSKTGKRFIYPRTFEIGNWISSNCTLSLLIPVLASMYHGLNGIANVMKPFYSWSSFRGITFMDRSLTSSRPIIYCNPSF